MSGSTARLGALARPGRGGRGISVAGTPDRGAVVAQARDLALLARRHGYRLDELVKILQNAY